MTTRVYVPVTSARLAELVTEGRLAGPLDAHAVTEALRQEWPDGDDEELEYAAMAAAADHSWSLRADGDPPRRYVIAADVGEVQSREGDELTSVLVDRDISWKHIASAHVDAEDYLGDDRDLAWFATQEIGELL